MQGHFEITVNGTRHQVARAAVDRPFLAWLRDDLGLIGTKAGACSEGGCRGACTVCVLDLNGLGESTYRALSGCQLTLPMAAGRHFITVEALGDGERAHPARRALADAGTEGCGYCEAGLAMALFELYYRRDVATMEDVHDALAGHVCRCGAPHHAREAAVVLVREASALRVGSRVSREIERARPRRAATTRIAGDGYDAALAGLAPDAGGLSYIDPDGARFHRPRSLLELLRLRNEYAGARLVGAGTGSIRAGSGAVAGPLCILSSEAVVEMRAVFDLGAEWEIGAAVTLSSVREAVRGRCEMLDQALGAFANRGSRNRATLGGALCAPESAGEIGPVLIALGATVVIAGLGHEREMPLEDFLKDAPEESLRGEELVKAVKVPHTGGSGRLCGVARVAPRRRYAPSISNLAVNLELDGERRVLSARVATGAASARPVRAIACEQALVGQPWNGATVKLAAVALLEAAPRSKATLASAEYCRAVMGALFQKFFYENPAPETRRGQDNARSVWLAGSILTTPGETVPTFEVKAPMAAAEVFEEFETADELDGEGDVEEAVVAPGPASEDDVVDSPEEETPLIEEIPAESLIVIEDVADLDTSEQESETSIPEEPEQGDEGDEARIEPEVENPEPPGGVEEPEEDALGVIFVDAMENEVEAIGVPESDKPDKSVIAEPKQDDEGSDAQSEPEVENPEPPQDVEDPEEDALGVIFVDESEEESEAVEFPESNETDTSDMSDAGAVIANIFVDPKDVGELPDELPQDNAPEEVTFGAIFVDPDAVAPSGETAPLPEIENAKGEEVPEAAVLFEDEAPSGESDDDPPLESIFVDMETDGANGESDIEPETAPEPELSEGVEQEPVESPEILSEEQDEAASQIDSVTEEDESTSNPEPGIVSAPTKRGALPPPRKVSLEVQPRNGIVIEKEESPS